MRRAEAEYLRRVAELGCVACELLGYPGTPAEIHHVREGCGLSQRSQSWLTVGLCPEHHRGKSGVHSNGNKIPALKMDELDLLARTIERLQG